MCGIAGVIAWANPYRTTRETLSRMSASIAHRGPDGEGLYLNHEQDVTPDRPQAALAFRRLAILDPDPRAMQPFHLYGTDGNPRLTLTFNGEIYNFRDLRAELTQLRPDYAWRTTGDTEVLLLAYDTWGEACLAKLNGMYAFAVWDEQKKELFLARDRMGQKPLYFAGSPGSGVVAYASERAALAPLSWITRSLGGVDLREYLRWGYCETGNVDQLRPGTRMLCRPGGWLTATYFRPESGTPAMSDRDAVDATRDLLRQAVARQLVSDVPIGCFLSGGIDSSVIAASMRSAVPRDQPVHTFSVRFDDPRYDESAYAAAVARHLGTTHHEFTVHPDAAADLPKLAAVFGDPFADSSALPTHYLSRETRAHVKVALSGDGGDELFGGYDRYRAMRLGQRLRLPRIARHALAGVPGAHPKSLGARVRRFAATLDLDPPRRYASYLQIFPDALITELGLRPPQGDTHRSAYAEFLETRDVVQSALALDRRYYLPDDLLTKVDRASMLHNLEVRSPFMDHDLVRFASALTTDQLLKGGPKRMLREAFAKDLPDFVFRRKKMGFAVPIGDWFRTSLRPMLRDQLFATNSFARAHFNLDIVRKLVEDHETARADHSHRLYALLMLELWHALP